MRMMSKNWTSKWLAVGFMFWIVLAALSVYLLYPLRQRLKFGIDLVGGSYITLKVETNKAVEHELHEKARQVTNALKVAKLAVPTSHSISGATVSLNFADTNAATAALSTARDHAAGLKVGSSDQVVSLTLSGSAVDQLEHWALESNIEVLRSRLNVLGVEEIKITAQGDDSIVVELPDVTDPARAKEMIGTPAMLEFKVVEARGRSHVEILEEFGGEVPAGMQIITNRDVHGGQTEFLLVADTAEVTGRHLIDAAPSNDDRNHRIVTTFKLNPEGAEKFHELTRDNVHRQLAAILDGQAISVAQVNEPISGGNVQITGNFNIEQAKELATLLKSGAFVAPVSFSEERRIGPSLGSESINSGLKSCFIGLGLLLIFSIYYYRMMGILAFLALIYNLLLTMVALSLTGAALTLPGIAGMVLTVGMAIDASVLIYERIKELLREGVSMKHAVDDGFSNAMTVILDSNITTFIVGVVLFRFGTGPIQGFAVTMMIGIIATLITGLFFLKSLIHFVLDKQKVQKISI